MPKYEVHLPVTMDVVVGVEADTKEEAIEKAFDVEWTANFEGAECFNCETHKHVTRGNCCSAVLNDAYAEQIDD